MRHLERVQMSTDSALLVSQIILTDQVPFPSIPFVNDPEMSNPENEYEFAQLTGFRYVSQQFDLESGSVGPNPSKEMHMHPRIGGVLIFEDLDLGNMDLV